MSTWAAGRWDSHDSQLSSARRWPSKDEAVTIVRGRNFDSSHRVAGIDHAGRSGAPTPDGVYYFTSSPERVHIELVPQLQPNLFRPNSIGLPQRQPPVQRQIPQAYQIAEPGRRFEASAKGGPSRRNLNSAEGVWNLGQRKEHQPSQSEPGPLGTACSSSSTIMGPSLSPPPDSHSNPMRSRPHGFQQHHRPSISPRKNPHWVSTSSSGKHNHEQAPQSHSQRPLGEEDIRIIGGPLRLHSQSNGTFYRPESLCNYEEVWPLHKGYSLPKEGAVQLRRPKQRPKSIIFAANSVPEL